MKHEIIPIMADCRVGFSPPIPTHKQTGKKLSQNTKCHSERLFCHPERSAPPTHCHPERGAPPTHCHPERSAAEPRDLALEHNSTPATSSPRHCERSEAISLHHSLFLVRHSILTTTFTFLLLLFLIAAPAHAKYGGGTGEPNDPYLIFTAEQMNEIGLSGNWDDWDKCFKLMADIDLAGYTGTAFNIIGSYGNPFTGVFDGNDHTISNFTYTSTGTPGIGLFSYVGTREANAEIKDLGLIGPNVDAGTGDNVGLLVGFIRVENVTITNCYVEGGTVSGGQFVGGLLGNNYYGTITNCYATANVSGTSNYVGGLLGRNSGIITNCYSTGSVSGDWYVGGLVGDSWHGKISACYSRANVAGRGYVGGLVGDNFATIYNCYSIGSVFGTADVGGLVGYGHGQVTGCFWDTETSGQDTSEGGTGKTTAEMQTASTFIGWGCESVWTIDEGKGYPRLVWENVPGQLITIPYGLYGGGSGEPNDPYLIYTAEQLNTIGSVVCDWDKHFKLMADIDLAGFTGISFSIIGSNYLYPFTGVFDGDGHTISNFSYISKGRHQVGFFGYVGGKNAVIKELGLIAPDVDARTGYYVGSLVGFLSNGTISNCFVEGGSVSGVDYVGGLVGSNRGIVTNCYATAIVSGDDNVGGLVGENGFSGPLPSPVCTISNCYSTGSVTGKTNVGGLVGENYGTITNCYSTSSVMGDNHVGGLVGGNRYLPATITNCYSTGSVTGHYDDVGGLVGYHSGTITNCYSTGSVSGTTDVGGLVGYEYQVCEVTNSFWDIETSGQSTSAGGTGKTTAEMQNPNTFMDAGWDFVSQPDGPHDIWAAPAGGGYPILWWQLSPLPALPAFSEGTGNPNDPYLISTPNDLNLIGHNPRLMKSHFKLIDDIDLTGTDCFLIGSKLFPFAGVFDGSGHTISNFSYISTGTSYIGLFGYVTGEIKDLGLIDPNVDAGTGNSVGSLAGKNGGNITNCYVEDGRVSGHNGVGGLVGGNSGTISNCYSTGSVSGTTYVGGLVGYNIYYGTITNCYATGSVTGRYVGGLVGSNEGGTITNCYSTGSVSGTTNVGGLVGANGGREGSGTISNCYSTGTVSGNRYVGGLVGDHDWGTISNCYATGSVTGTSAVGGLVGGNDDTISNSCSSGSVTGGESVGGLVGRNWRTITNCYSTGSVTGTNYVGGLVGYHYSGSYTSCFWDSDVNPGLTGVGNITDPPEVMGRTTAQMQTQSTFTDAGWDFETPVWTIDEGADYPRLWWELVPVLHAEPDVTLGTSNTISWEPVPGANDYYAECAADANFTSIVCATGWITETSYTFTGLELGQVYWYSVKARNSAGTETNWSNVESSLQVTLADAVDMMLDPDTLKNKNMKNALLNKINTVQQMLDAGRYEKALNKLQNDILQKTDGCAETGRPDKNDWIITCEEQEQIYPLVIETIEYVSSLMD